MRGLVGADVRGEGRLASTYPAGVFLDPARRLPALLAAVTGGAPLVSAAVAAIGFPVGQVLVHLAHGAWRGSGVSAGAAAEPGSQQPGQPDGSVAGALHRHQRQNSLRVPLGVGAASALVGSVGAGRRAGATRGPSTTRGSGTGGHEPDAPAAEQTGLTEPAGAR